MYWFVSKLIRKVELSKMKNGQLPEFDNACGLPFRMFANLNQSTEEDLKIAEEP